jgi:membrane-bound metal-dependent hydrolase YbcI (DUF457 family)
VPSPIAHAAAGYLIYRGVSRNSAEFRPTLLWLCAGLSLLPDIDAAAGLLLGDMGRYHNNMMASPAFALFMSLVVGGIAWRLNGAFRPYFLLALVCYLTHITMDFFTNGRGIMLLWPLTEERFTPPFSIFYGVHWSDGLYSSRHIWTAVTELGTILVFVLLVVSYRYFWRRWKVR